MERLFANHLDLLLEDDPKALVKQLYDTFNSHNAIILTKSDGSILLTNERFRKLTGYSKEQSATANFSILETNYFPKSKWNHIYHMVKKGMPWNGILRLKDKLGKLFWTNTTIMSISSSANPSRHQYLYTLREVSHDVVKEHEETNSFIESIENKFESHADYLQEEVAQLISGIKLKLNVIKPQLKSDKECNLIKSEIEELERYTEESLEKIQSTAHDMMPKILIKEGLLASLESLAYNRFHDLDISTNFRLKHNVNKIISISIYKIIKRVLDNCLKSKIKDEIHLSIDSFYDFVLKIYIPHQSKIDVKQLKNDKSRVKLLGGTLHTSSDKGMFLIEINFEPRVAFSEEY